MPVASWALTSPSICASLLSRASRRTRNPQLGATMVPQKAWPRLLSSRHSLSRPAPAPSSSARTTSVWSPAIAAASGLVTISKSPAAIGPVVCTTSTSVPPATGSPFQNATSSPAATGAAPPFAIRAVPSQPTCSTRRSGASKALPSPGSWAFRR